MIRFASLMGAGAISIYNFSWNLQSVPLSVIGVSYSLAAFPTLTKLYSSGNKEKFIEHIQITARHIIFLSMPVMILFFVLRAQIVRTILGTGQFNWSDTRLTAAALALFVLSLIPQSLIILFVRGYYSKGDTKKPLIINIFFSVLVIGLGYFFVQTYHGIPMVRYFIESLLRVEDLPGTEVLMLPLAYTIGMILNLIVLWISFQRDFPTFSKPVLKTLGQSFSTAVIIGYVAYVCLNVFSLVFNLDTVIGIFLQGFLSGIIGLLVGVLLLKAMNSPELEDIFATLKRKIWKAPVIVPEQKELVQ
jgi:putative peptidoglycan lipid II flippase